MPLYRYNISSPVDEVKFVRNESGGFRAYLHAAEGANQQDLQRIYAQLQETGHVLVPCHENGRAMLEVRGFKTPDGLRATLAEADATIGKPVKDDLAEDKLTAGQWLKKYALFMIAGIYLLSDYFYIKYEDVKSREIDDKKEKLAEEKLTAAIERYNGTNLYSTKPLPRSQASIDLENKIKDFNASNHTTFDDKKITASLDFSTEKSPWAKFWATLAGKGYLVGSSTSMLSLLLRGNTSNAEVGEISRYVMEAAKKHGLTPEEDPSLLHAASLHDTRSTFVQKYSQYSSELMNLSFATAGLAITKTNIESLQKLNAKEKYYDFLTGSDSLRADQRHRSEKSVATKDIILGIGTMASGVASSFMTEKKHDPNVPKKKGIAGVIERMKENPLSIAGAGYLVSTFVHLWSSIQEMASIRKDNKELVAKGQEAFPIYHTGFRLAFVVMNLVAETGMLFTSKGHGEGVRNDSTLDDTATAMVASLIMRQPEEKHQELVVKMAKELSNATAIAKPVAEVAQMIEHQLQNIKKNPWSTVVPEVKIPKELLTPATEETVTKEKEIAIPATKIPQELLNSPVEEKSDIPQKTAASFGILPREKVELVKTSLMDRAAANENAVAAVMP